MLGIATSPTPLHRNTPTAGRGIAKNGITGACSRSIESTTKSRCETPNTVLEDTTMTRRRTGRANPNTDRGCCSTMHPNTLRVPAIETGSSTPSRPPQARGATGRTITRTGGRGAANQGTESRTITNRTGIISPKSTASSFRYRFL